DELAGHFALAKDFDGAGAFGETAGQLAEGDADFAGDQIGGDLASGAFGFDGGVEGAQGDDAAAAGDLEFEAVIAEGHGENALAGLLGGALGGADAQDRKSTRLNSS